MSTATQVPVSKQLRPPHWGPICCKQEMYEMIRRAILHADGSVVYCSVWHCLNCGRLLL